MSTDLIIALSVVFALLILVPVVIILFGDNTILPSGRPTPKDEKLLNMSAMDLAASYSKKDLEALYLYVTKRIGKSTRKEINLWNGVKHNIKVALNEQEY